jgi:hypothetical protein
MVNSQQIPLSKKKKTFLEALQQSGEMPASGEAQKIQREEQLLEKKFEEKVIPQLYYLQKEQQEIYSREKRERDREVKILQSEVENLAQATEKLQEKLDKDLDIAAQQPTLEGSIYELNWLRRLKRAIQKFTAKIENASLWLSAFAQKKAKRGFFWSQAMSKKGGAQYMFSGEHSAARSVG